MDFVPKGFYALEKAVLLLARELNRALWDHAKMPLAEINAYEGLGEKTHFRDLGKVVRELSRRDRKTGKLPDNHIAERFEAYKDAQKLLRRALNASELRSVLLIEATGQRLEQVADAWAQYNAMNWFNDGRTFLSTGSTKRIRLGGAPFDVTFVEAPTGLWASILIDCDSFSNWCYSGEGGRPPEQGECLLTDGLVDPPLGVLYPKERAKIFVSQDDFQRSVAKQEGKQEAVPPDDPLPTPKPAPEAEAIRIFDAWRESRGGDNIPSEKEDIDYMKQFGVSRDRVRKLRQRPGVKRRSTGKRRLP